MNRFMFSLPTSRLFQHAKPRFFSTAAPSSTPSHSTSASSASSASATGAKVPSTPPHMRPRYAPRWQNPPGVPAPPVISPFPLLSKLSSILHYTVVSALVIGSAYGFYCVAVNVGRMVAFRHEFEESNPELMVELRAKKQAEHAKLNEEKEAKLQEALALADSLQQQQQQQQQEKK